MRCAHLTPLMVIGALVVSAAAQEYEVGPGDVLTVIVLNQAGLTGEFTVDPEGFMVYPFVGRVKAAGLSALEIERKLGTLLSDGYLKRPQISVAVKQFRSHRVFVTGEAARPGPYGLRPDRMLSSLLQDVGDLTPQAGHEILIIRPPRHSRAVAGTGVRRRFGRGRGSRAFALAVPHAAHPRALSGRGAGLRDHPREAPRGPLRVSRQGRPPADRRHRLFPQGRAGVPHRARRPPRVAIASTRT